MIPYYPPPRIDLGFAQLDSWTLLVVLGMVAAAEFCRYRAIRRGLSVRVSVDCVMFTVAMGFAVGHIIHIVAYNPHYIDEIGWKVLLPWYGGWSSYGGFLGAGIALPLFLKLWKKVPFWAYLDHIAMGFWLGWGFGRFGCFTAHDHIGRSTDFFLAVDFPRFGPRHDLGLYESIVAFSMFALLFSLDRKPDRRHGLYSALTLLLYPPVRFCFDFLRATDMEEFGLSSDVRWAGLTPAQYGSIVLFCLGIWMFFYRRNAPQQDLSAEVARDFQPGPLARLLNRGGSSEPPDAPTA